jgi:hypothetical protein
MAALLLAETLSLVSFLDWLSLEVLDILPTRLAFRLKVSYSGLGLVFGTLPVFLATLPGG